MGGFPGPTGNTVPSLFAAVVAVDPSLPLLTYYDDATGERTELSGASLANWAAKTANLAVDGCGLGGGSVAAIWLPPHWQTAGVLLGCWTAGLVVAYGEPTADAAEIAFASAEAVAAGAPTGECERYVLGLDPMGRPMREAALPEAPELWQDYSTAVRAHGDHYGGPPARPGDVALLDPDGNPVSHEQLLRRARERAERLAIPAAGRVLIDADAYPYPLDWLLAPLVLGSSIVLCTHTDAKKVPARAETEKAVPAGPPVGAAKRAHGQAAPPATGPVGPVPGAAGG
jgi:uncharacterized protein (TIGR03089 family)